MSTKASDPQKRTDPRPKYLYLGTDAEGGAHYYDTRNDRVHVARGPDREHVQVLDDQSVDDWMAHVEETRGWAERHYGGWELVFDRLADAFDGA